MEAPLLCEPMQAGDLEEVLLIEQHAFSSPWTRPMFLAEMDNRVSRLSVFRSEGRIVGYLCFWEVLDEAHLMNIAVHPAMRRLGFGRRMMTHLEQVCRRDGVKRIILDVGRRNVPARDLYRKCGFSGIGFRKKYYADIEDDAVVMEKRLSIEESDELAIVAPSKPAEKG